MSADTNPGKGSEANDPRGSMCVEMAASIGLWCLETPEELVKAASLEMIGTGNQTLLTHTESVAQALTAVKGEISGKWFMRGASVAFMYFVGVTQVIDNSPLRTVSVKNIAQVGEEGKQLYREELVDAEQNIGEELSLKRRERATRTLEQLDEPLHQVVTAFLIDNTLLLEARAAFLSGAIMINRLLKGQPQQTEGEE